MATADLGAMKVRLLAQVVGSSEPPIEVGILDVPVHAVDSGDSAGSAMTVRCADCAATVELASDGKSIAIAALADWSCEGVPPQWRCPEHGR